MDKGAQTRIHEEFRRLLSGSLQLFIFFHVLIFDWGASSEKWVLATQVHTKGRWLKLFLEWFMSAPTLRGQSKHRTTPSNRLHPMLQHSCHNGDGLTQNDNEPSHSLNCAVFSALYWCKTYGWHFIKLQHLWDWGSTFHLHHQKRPSCLWSSSVASLK